MAQVMCDAGHETLLWGRNAEVVGEINTSHTNLNFIPGIKLPTQLKATTDIVAALDFGKAIVLAVPAQSLRSSVMQWKKLIRPTTPIISTLKGIESDSQMRMTEILVEVLGISQSQIGLITGPNLASEIALRQPSGAVAASESKMMTDLMIELFTTPYFRVYPSDDLIGCELAGAAKSVIALAVGMTIGLDLGENTQAMIITRGLSEVARFGNAYGSDPLTFLGLAGMGDLVASCGSALSRNRTFGEVLGRTGSIVTARNEVAKTVEGVASAGAILELAHRVGVEVPIIEAVSDVVNSGLSPIDAINRLMTVDIRAEI
jgi:glycerol-3-phosphate dehydrogenase (NAD(P)+)